MAAPAKPLELKLEVAQLSDPGRDPNKQVNEDSCGHQLTNFGHLCVLCDGMGGHYGGQEASRRAITTIFEQINLAPAASPAAALKFAVEIAARRVYELGGPADNKIRPGSTVVAMLFHDQGVDVAHVGDSRAYVIRSGQIYPLTRDHSMVQAMIDAGFITEEQAIGHPDANKITRALGMKPEVEVEVRPEPMELFPGDLLLTASDGLTDLALPKDILGATRQALASGGLPHGCEQLVRMANDRGGHDNITVQLVRIIGTPAQKTRAGVTQPGALASTVSEMAQAPTQPQFQAPAAAPTAAASQPQAAHPAPTPMAPVADTAVGRSPSTTIPMQPAATAHDGTSRNSHAAQAPQAGAGAPHAGAPGYGPRGTVPNAEPRQNFATYRSDNARGLPLPPQSTRFDPGRPTPVDPSAWGSASAIDASGGRSGGGVLFMALAISFVVACVAIALAWLLFFR
jgi:PPM family protein phosphatase